MNIYNIFAEDSLMNYIILRIAKSYFFFKKIGYYYIKNFESITNNLFYKSELILKCRLLYLNIVYENSKHTKYEKDMSNFLLSYYIQIFNRKQTVENIKQKDIMQYFFTFGSQKVYRRKNAQAYSSIIGPGAEHRGSPDLGHDLHARRGCQYSP
jgi:hypothetical protein